MLYSLWFETIQIIIRLNIYPVNILCLLQYDNRPLRQLSRIQFNDVDHGIMHALVCILI